MKRTKFIQYSSLSRVRAAVPKKSRCFAYEEQVKEFRRNLLEQIIRYIRSHRFPALLGAIIATIAQLTSLFAITPVANAQTITPVHPEPPYIQTVKLLPKLPDSSLSPLSEISPITPPPTQNAVNSPQNGCATGVVVGDYYTNLVMQRESGGNSCARNPSGACGLFQALPCSKMGCSLYDVACQENWGESYIISVYGSSLAAWNHELNYGWY